MPEGPEVTTIANELSKLLTGAKIHNWTFTNKSRYSTTKPPGYTSFISDITGPRINVTIHSIENKGKLIYWRFSNGWVLLQTLGMSGGWYINEQDHTASILEYTTSKDNPGPGRNPKQCIYYNDQRRFGTFKWISHENADKDLDKKLNEIGPDMLNNPPSLDNFRNILQKSKNKDKLINKVITDQKQISGIGNYLRSEILYAAKLNPHRTIKSLSNKDMETLYKSILDKLTNSYKVGGASIRHYSDLYNIKGRFEFNMAVYKKTHDPKGRVVKMEKIGSDTQSTYWVPTWQK